MQWTYTIGPGYYYQHMGNSAGAPQNAENIKNYLTNISGDTYTPEAIIGIIANAEHESYMNPGQQEHGYGGSTSRGYGLLQWTPASSKIIAYANNVGGDWYDGDIQLDYAFDLGHNVENSWIMNEPYTFAQYRLITDIYLATKVFFRNFERGTWHSVMNEYAQYWYDTLYGSAPPLPGIDPQLVILMKKKKREERY